jgi:hypothetical protein
MVAAKVRTMVPAAAPGKMLPRRIGAGSVNVIGTTIVALAGMLAVAAYAEDAHNVPATTISFSDRARRATRELAFFIGFDLFDVNILNR